MYSFLIPVLAKKTHTLKSLGQINRFYLPTLENPHTIKQIHIHSLEYLLNYWPAIKKAVPHATLLITGSFALWGNSDEENERFFKKLYDLTQKLDGVNLLKRIEKPEVAILQARSELMLYPTVFDEMFCISALECMSVGTPVISGKRAAMSERIRNGVGGYSLAGSPKNLFIRKSLLSMLCLY